MVGLFGWESGWGMVRVGLGSASGLGIHSTSGGHLVRGRQLARARGIQHAGDAKVADFDCALFAQEDILRFQVAMQNVEAVDIMDGVDHLIQKAHKHY